MLRALFIPVLSAAFLVGACTTTEEPAAPADMALMDSPYDPEDMLLKIKGADAAVALDSAAKVAAFLGDLEAPADASLRGRINKLLNNPNAKLAGLGGVQTLTSLGVANATLNAQGNFGAGLDSVDVVGQIQATDPETGTGPGFYFDPSTGMYIWVQMTTTATRTVGNAPDKVFEKVEMFRVEVPAIAGDLVQGVQVEPRAATGDAFPRWTAAAGFSVDPKDFLYKLWAVGEDVQVTDYWVDDCRPQCGTWKKYKANTRPMPKPIAKIFEPSAVACFDMMFKVDPSTLPNGTLPADAEPPFYCLGRCKQPPILNTK